MKKLLEFLSGNIPGGFELYLFILAGLFLILYYIYRVNELYTRAHFRKWFFTGGSIFTIIYIILWFNFPPDSLLKRYSVWILPADGESLEMATQLQHEISASVRPFTGKNNYYFPHRWLYLANSSDRDRMQSPVPAKEIAGKIPIDKLLLGKLNRQNQTYELQLDFLEFPGGKLFDRQVVQFKADLPEEAINDILSVLKKEIPVSDRYNPVSGLEGQQLFALGKDSFFRGDNATARRHFESLSKENPNHHKIQKWLSYVRIREAASRKKQDKHRNPFEKEKPLWQVQLEESRSFLLKLLREDFDAHQRDELLNLMIAESWMLEENFGDAELFLKNAYIENPFNVEVLENLTFLHPSRYKDLGFANETEIFERILRLCPVHFEILNRYIEKVVLTAPVDAVKGSRGERAIQNYLALYPRSVAGWILMGKYYHQALENEQAVRAFLTADSLDSANALVKYNLGVVYFRRDQRDIAEKYFRTAVALTDYPDAHLYLGVIYKERGEYQKALEEFRYRVSQKEGEDDFYAFQAMKGIREILAILNEKIPE